MRTAPATIASARPRNNVAILPTPTDTSMTPLLIRQAKRDAAKLLPAGWFTFMTDETATAGQAYDSLLFCQVGGVPVGHYGLHREPSRQFSVTCLDAEPDEDGEQVERALGLFGTTEEAVRAIRRDLQEAVSNLQRRADRWEAALAD